MGFPIKVLAFRIFLLGSMMKLVYLNPIETSSKAFPKALSEADETENGIESSEEQSAVRFDDYEQTEEVFESLQFEEGNNFQGDIDLEPDQLEILMSNDTEDGSSSLTRIGLLSELYRWPKNKHGKVVVPFVISNNAGYSKLKMSTQTFDVLITFCVCSNSSERADIKRNEGDCNSHMCSFRRKKRSRRFHTH